MTLASAQSSAAQARVAPHSEASERAVLAAIILDSQRNLPVTAGRLHVEDFYLERHQRIYESLLALQESATGIDLRTVQADLEQRDLLERAGGLAYLAGLEVDLPDLSRIEDYVEIVKERALRRRLMAACDDTYKACFDGGMVAKEALGVAEQAILELGEEAIPRGFAQLGDVFRETLVDLEKRPDNPFPGIDTGFIDFDRMTHGLHPGHLLIIAGRPGMGKSSLAMNIATHVTARENKAAAVFSLEMSAQELGLRVLCGESGVSFSRLRKGRLSQREWTTLRETIAALSHSKLYIDDSASATFLEVASKARRLKLEKGLDLLVIDYLQLMSSGGRFENRNLEIASITRGLKQLAKDLQIPVMCLSQLSRQTERRGSDRRPQLADLRESGAIEQDADLVGFVYRDEVYNPDDPGNHGLAELIVSKHRSGETGTVHLAFIGEITKFCNLEHHATPPGGPGFDNDLDPVPPGPRRIEDPPAALFDDPDDLLDL